MTSRLNLKTSKSSKMEIGMPYNIKHELHIAVDQLNQVLEMLPETYKNYIDQTIITSPVKYGQAPDFKLTKNFQTPDIKRSKSYKKYTNTISTSKSLHNSPSTTHINQDTSTFTNSNTLTDLNLNISQIGSQSILFDINDILGTKKLSTRADSIDDSILESDSEYFLDINVDLDMVDLAFSDDNLSYYQNNNETYP
ncbi:hypothetical protein BB561_006462 [Smittium simulii]|uniref:CRIB domain-containing protein n=1 Tax=Smittium simulii TaxID=133385 RepID=A0A2T9Y460_9FUNG|nr:hypothetical protein BB561_006462 [Smittium simulii]